MPIPVPVAKLLIRTGLAQRLPAIRQLMGDGIRYLKYFNGRVLGSPNVHLEATHTVLTRAAEPGAIDLSLGAPAFSLPLSFEPGAADLSYPPLAGIPGLRAALAEKIQAERGLTVDPEHGMAICNGVSQAIALMLDTYVDPGEGVALFDPCFFVYRLAAMNRRAKIREIPITLEEGRMVFTEAALRRALAASKVLLLNTPHNPTGGMLTAEDLGRIAYWARRYDVLIFSDEVYEPFAYDVPHISIATFRDAARRCIRASSFSKSYGMAGARVGYLSGEPHLVRPMKVSMLAGAPFVSVPAQLAALAALRVEPSTLARAYAAMARKRALVERALAAAGLDCPLPSGSFYFWVPVDGLRVTAAEFADRLMAEEKVVVVPGDPFGRHGKRWIRLSYAGSEAELTEGLARMRRFLANHWTYLLPRPPRLALPAVVTAAPLGSPDAPPERAPDRDPSKEAAADEGGWWGARPMAPDQGSGRGRAAAISDNFGHNP